ncbi:hypothetical protein SHY69_05985, partial [Streptococcus agalactiae]|nr:hypothetical protein [Streptococcus agalactiae]
FYTELGNSSISDEHVFFVALHFTTRGKIKEIHLTFLSPVRVNQEFSVQVVDNTVIIFQHQILW